MVRESNDENLRTSYAAKHPDLNPKFIFALAAYNMRNNEIGAIIGRSQLKRLNKIVARRNQNHELFLELINGSRFRKDFKLEGASNYAFNLVLNESDEGLMRSLKQKLNDSNIEFRQGSAGGGNQLRQPYLIEFLDGVNPLDFPETEHIHHFGMYIGNFPELTNEEISYVCGVINRA